MRLQELPDGIEIDWEYTKLMEDGMPGWERRDPDADLSGVYGYLDLVRPADGLRIILGAEASHNDYEHVTGHTLIRTGSLNGHEVLWLDAGEGVELVCQYQDGTQAHMYAKGADIASRDASEKIVIGGVEEVSMDGWTDHPDYLTCGHIHKRQHIWNTDWARYSGSVLPMSFAEVDYRHGVDLVTIHADGKHQSKFLEYEPQHKLLILPKDDEELTPKKLKKLIEAELDDRVDGKLDDHFVYLMLKVKLEKVSNDELAALEEHIATKNAVLCKTQRIIPSLDLSTISGGEQIRSIDDILNRNPLDTIREVFAAKNKEMSEHQEQMLSELLRSITSESNNQ